MTTQLQDMGKPNILILSCRGGNGHEAARRAIESHLGERYSYRTYFPFTGLKINRLINSERFYNWMVANGLNGTVNLLARVSPFFLTTRFDERVKYEIAKRIERNRSVCVISVAPVLNRYAILACNEYRVPFCLVTTDVDITNWVYGMKWAVKLFRSSLACTVGIHSPYTTGILVREGIKPDSIIQTGFPVREEFFKSKSSDDELRSELNLPYQKPIILLMYGGTGSKRICDVLYCLASKTLGVHFVIITGRNNNHLAEQIRKIVFHFSNTYTLIDFTERVSDYMRAAKILISKPGPGTMAEVSEVYKRYKRPYFLADADKCFWWERPVLRLIQDGNYGQSFTIENIARLVKDTLISENPRPDLDKIPENTFAKNIQQIIEKLFKEALSHQKLERDTHCFLKQMPYEIEEIFHRTGYFAMPTLQIPNETNVPFYLDPSKMIDPVMKFCSRFLIGVSFLVFNNETKEVAVISLYQVFGRNFCNLSIKGERSMVQGILARKGCLRDCFKYLSRTSHAPYDPTFFEMLLLNQHLVFRIHA